MDTLIYLIFSLVVLIFSVIIHEIAHGSVALTLGDPTAKDAGRLSLNPLKHLDPFGSVILPIITYFIFGFPLGSAKPVPINSSNFRNKKWGEIAVSLAGSFTNLLLGIIFSLIVRFFPLSPSLSSAFSYIAFLNFLLGVFNLIPIPPLDGSHLILIFFPENWTIVKIYLQQFGLIILISLIYVTNGHILDWVLSLVQFIFKFFSGVFFQ